MFPKLTITQRKQIAKKRERNPDGTFASKAASTVKRIAVGYLEKRDLRSSQKAYNKWMNKAVDSYDEQGAAGKYAIRDAWDKNDRDAARAWQSMALSSSLKHYNKASQIASDFAKRSKKRGFNQSITLDNTLMDRDRNMWNHKYHSQGIAWLKRNKKLDDAKSQAAFLKNLKKR